MDELDGYTVEEVANIVIGTAVYADFPLTDKETATLMVLSVGGDACIAVNPHAAAQFLNTFKEPMRAWVKDSHPDVYRMAFGEDA